MRTNRRRHENLLPIASIATWLVIGVFACGAGLYYVWCKNELHSIGAEIKMLERRLVDLRNQNDVAQVEIQKFSSTATLQGKFTSGSIDLVPIARFESADLQIATTRAENEVRTISNSNRGTKP
jgi:hypothetical protein